MKEETWEEVDISLLWMTQALSFKAFNAAQEFVTPQNVAPSQIKTYFFLKYVYLSLLDKAHFLQFYKLILT